MKYESQPFDPHYVAYVLADIWGREHGCKLTITLTPKEGYIDPFADSPYAPKNKEERT